MRPEGRGDMRRPMVFVLLAGLAAMLASVMVYSALKRREAEVANAMSHNVEVVVAAYDLPLGTKIELGEVKLARWSADSLPDGAYTDPRQVLGSYVKNSLVANEPIVQAKLFTGDKTAGIMPLLIPFGMRAVSVPVDEVSDVAGFVLPHTRVDVLVATTGEGGGDKAFSKVILQNVEVLAVAQEVEQKKDEPEIVKVVTLLVTPQESERLALASHSGTLRLAMRNYNDNKIVLTSGSDVAQMLRAYSLAPDVPVMAVQPEPRRIVVAHRPKPVEIEILRNGKSSESVSFVNEAAANFDDSPHAATHIRKAAVNTDEDADDNATDSSADTTDSDSTTVASAPEPEHHDLASPLVAPSSAPPANTNYVPTPKTIDIP
jgi:pilus assembly protein CpaB